MNVSDAKYYEDVTLISGNASKLRYLTFVVTIPGILWNGFLLLCFYRNKNAIWIKDTKNVICNIISDFVISILSTVILAITIIPQEIQWPLEICYIKNYLTVTLQCVSLNHILALCIDRCRIALNVRTLHRPEVSPYKRSAAIWKCICIIAVVPFFIHINEPQKPEKECTSETVALTFSPRLVLIFHTVMTSAPWFITNILYIVTSVILWRRIRKVQPVQYKIQPADNTTEMRSYNRRIKYESTAKKNATSSTNLHSSSSRNIDRILNFSHLQNSQRTGMQRSVSSPEIKKVMCESITSRLGSQTECGHFGRSQASEHTKGMDLNIEVQSLHHLSEKHKIKKPEITSCTSNLKETNKTTRLHNLEIIVSAKTKNNTDVSPSNTDRVSNFEVVQDESVKEQSTSQVIRKEYCTTKPDESELRPSQNIPDTSGNIHKRKTCTKKHVMVTVGLLLMVFNISMWPVVVGLIGLQISEPFELEGKFFIFVFLNQTLNPIIYAIRLTRLRFAMQEFLRSCHGHH